VNRDFNAATNIWRCAVPERRPLEFTRANFVGEPLRVEMYKEKLKPMAASRSKKTGRRLYVGIGVLCSRETFSLR